MGLVRGMARTAVVAGTATAVSNRVSRRQARRWGEQDYDDQQAAYQQPAYQQPPPAQAPPPYPAEAAPAMPAPAADEGDALAAELERLANLHDRGILSEAEFSAAKA